MALQPGQVLQNRYRVVGVMGQGGMGSVYRAYDLRLSVACIIKELLITPDMARNVKDAAAQFQREASTLAGLHHPSLPHVTDYFSEQNSYYLVEDLIEGQSLGKLIGNAGLPEATVLKYADQLLEVLEYIHSQGVLHRDIKPANIIIRAANTASQGDGRAVLVDFGLVKLGAGGVFSATRTIIQGMGTPEYAPPEQYGGGGGTDQRSDLYALAATLYHTLTGQIPASATQQMSGARPLIPPRQFNNRVSANTEQVILKAMSLDRNARYPDATTMRAALRGRQAVAPIQPAFSQPLQRSTVILPPSALPTAPATRGGMGIGLLAGIAAILLLVLVALAIAVPGILSLNTPAVTETPVVNVAPHGPTSTVTAAAIRTTVAPRAGVTTVTPSQEPSETPPPSDTPQPGIPPSHTPPPSSTPLAPPSLTPLPSSTPPSSSTPQPTTTTTDSGPTPTKIPASFILSSPTNGQVLPPVTNVMGTVLCEAFNYYKINLWSISNSICKPCVLPAPGDHSMVQNGLLLQWDTTGVAAGDYRLELVAVCFGTEQNPKPSVNISIQH